MNRFSAIEQIAHDVEAWGEGWRFLYNPDDGGFRARLVRSHSVSLDVEIEIHHQRDPEDYFVFVASYVTYNKGPWKMVSCSVRSPINRKAIAYINTKIDELARREETR
jgi:hypothetical protein